jgi:hypothetical protein
MDGHMNVKFIRENIAVADNELALGRKYVHIFRYSEGGFKIHFGHFFELPCKTF